MIRKKDIILFCLVILAFNGLSCGKKVYRENVHLRFVLFGNTNPESPFTRSFKGIKPLIRSINETNPAFVIHTGNLIHGGYQWMGINKNDVDIQYKNFYFLANKLNSPLYTVYGEKDSFDGASDLYLKYTGRHVYYSFNYGPFHFVVLNNIKSLSKQERKKQAQWFKKDIELNRDSSLIFVIAHEPFYSPSGGQLKSGVEADFYKFLEKNRINYVISGGSSML